MVTTIITLAAAVFGEDRDGYVQFLGSEGRALIISGDVGVLVDKVFSADGTISADEVRQLAGFGRIAELTIREDRLAGLTVTGEGFEIARSQPVVLTDHRPAADFFTLGRRVGDYRVFAGDIYGQIVRTVNGQKYRITVGDVVHRLIEAAGIPPRSTVDFEYRLDESTGRLSLFAYLGRVLVVAVSE